MLGSPHFDYVETRSKATVGTSSRYRTSRDEALVVYAAYMDELVSWYPILRLASVVANIGGPRTSPYNDISVSYPAQTMEEGSLMKIDRSSHPTEY